MTDVEHFNRSPLKLKTDAVAVHCKKKIAIGKSKIALDYCYCPYLICSLRPEIFLCIPLWQNSTLFNVFHWTFMFDSQRSVWNDA